jgi:hypothetical protein
MTQQTLHRFGLDLRLVHQPIAQRMTQVMKAEPLTRLDLHPGLDRGGSQMVSDKNRCAQMHPALRPEEGEDEIVASRA